MPSPHAHAQRFGLEAPERYVLPNGLEVILSRDERQPFVAVWMHYRVGSRDDPEGYAGLAHTVEHMTFRGSRHVPPLEMLGRLERAGARSANASTHPDWTAYYAVLPAHELPLALWLESERMAFTLESMNDEGFQIERDVVLAERRERSGLGGAIAGIVQSELYPPDHPYRSASGAGDEEGFTVEHTRWFFQQWYRPDNATLIVAGSFDPPRARAEIEKFFGPVTAPPQPAPERAPAAAIALGGRAELHTVLPAPRDRVEWSWLAPCEFAQCGTDLVALQQLLAGTEESRLRRLLVTESKLASSLSFAIDPYETHTRISLSADVSLAAEPEAVAAAVEAALRQLAEEPIDDRELGLTRVALRTRIVSGFEPLLGRAEALALYRSAAEPGALYSPNAALEHVATLSAERLRDGVQRYLPLDRCVVLYEHKRERAPGEGRLQRRVGSARPASLEGTSE